VVKLPSPPFRSALAFSLGAWLVLTEVGVEGWYRWHERSIPAQPQWTVQWPQDAPGLKEVPIAEKAAQYLRYDEGRSATWLGDGHRWQAMFFRWDPGRIAPYLAKTHTPAACLPAAGKTLETISDLQIISVAGLNLPFRTYAYRENGRSVYVWYCLWEDRPMSKGSNRNP